MNKSTAILTLIALLIAFVASSLVVNPELGAFVPAIADFTSGPVGDAIGGLLSMLLSSFLGLDEALAGPIVDVLLLL